jgi:transglutaminase-like putative cysteine protease
MARTVAWIAVAGLIGAGALAFAQAPPKRHKLHEDLPAPAQDDSSPMIGEEPREGRNPAAFSSGDKVLPEPAADQGKPGEPVLGAGGFAADRDTEARPDYNTGPDGTLKYVSVFNPDVLPFKRMTALDAVRDDYTLFVESPSQVELPVGGKSDPSRDRFWGSVMIELEPGREVPLPSVAPDMRILSYETTPAVALTFSKDGADNFYVRSDESSARGTHRLVFLVDADAGYFAPTLPARSYTLRQVRAEARQRGLLPALPAGVADEAARSLAALDIDPDLDLGQAFNKLVAYHRSFEAKQLDDVTGNVYRDLFDTQAGVCRHRSFTFIITALAAGIPTRYVTNEAHAFVEVWFPGREWQRIDLGGAALRMEVSGADGKTLHRPRRDDPFAKPPEYTDGYTQLEGDIRGLTDDQLADKREPLGDGASGDFGPLVDDSGSGSGSGSGIGDDVVGPGDDIRQRDPDPDKLTPTVTITLADEAGYRGEAIQVVGVINDPKGPVDGARVDLFVAPRGEGGNDARLIGRGATGADGSFTIAADLPGDLDLRVYEIYASTPETATHNAAVSD